MKMLAIVITETLHIILILQSKQMRENFVHLNYVQNMAFWIFFLISRNILHNLSICVFIVHNVHTSYRLIYFFCNNKYHNQRVNGKC